MTARPFRVHRILPAAAAVTLAASAWRAGSGGVGAWEERVFRRFNDAPDRLRAPAWTVMQAGSLGAVFALAIGTSLLGRGRKASVVLVSGTGVWLGVKAVKPIVHRDRPDAHLDDVTVRGNHQTGCGYPSGHAAVATTLALVTAQRRQPIATLAAVATAAATGAARLYVGAHLPLDVAGGFAIGTLAGSVARRALREPGMG